jgi:hypothetical protein
LDCWKKQSFTHEIASKNTKSHIPDCRKTQNCTPENKKSHTRLPKSGTVPIPGTTKKANLEANVEAVSVKLCEEEMQELESAIPPEAVSGERYHPALKAYYWLYALTPPLSSWKGAAAHT